MPSRKTPEIYGIAEELFNYESEWNDFIEGTTSKINTSNIANWDDLTPSEQSAVLEHAAESRKKYLANLKVDNTLTPKSSKGSMLDIQEDFNRKDPTKFAGLITDNEPGVKGKLVTMKVRDIIPSQWTDDIFNDSAKENLRNLKSKTVERSKDIAPIVVDEGGKIIDGNHRYSAAYWNGDDEVLVLQKVKGAKTIQGLPDVEAWRDHIPSKAREKSLVNIATRHQVYLEGLKTGEAKKINDFLKTLDVSIRTRLITKDLSRLNQDKLKALLVKIRSDVKLITKEYIEEVNGSLLEIAKAEAQFEVNSLSVVKEHPWIIPTNNQLRTAVFTNPLSIPGISEEGLLKNYISGFSKSTQDRIAQSLRAGYYEGKTTNQIVQDIRGTRAAGYTDGIIARVGREATTLVRTSIQHLSQQSRQAVWEENSSLVKKVRIVATLDGRTSRTCQSLDGQVFERDKGPRPPFHPNCRTTTVAVLDQRFADLSKGATRRSRNPDGTVDYIPREKSYYDWLKDQPTDFQDSVIGPTRRKLLMDGGLSAQRFQELQLGKNFKPLTLKQMQELEPVAFSKSNITG